MPFPPGGATELGARIFAQPLGQALGQPVIIETRPGADGIIASEAVKLAAPDGYTLYYGTGNATSILATGQFALLEKLDMVHIPYRGDGPLSIDLVGGRVQLAIATPGTLAPQVKEGKLRVLATLLPNRNPLLPDAPTMAEAGLAQVSITPWGGLFGPAKMPKEIVDRLARAVGLSLD